MWSLTACPVSTPTKSPPTSSFQGPSSSISSRASLWSMAMLCKMQHAATMVQTLSGRFNIPKVLSIKDLVTFNARLNLLVEGVWGSG